jgi:hypothetical protein
MATVLSILNGAAQNAGIIGVGQSLDSESLADYLTRYNDLINLWQTQGLKLWTRQDLSVSLTVNVGVYNIGIGQAVNMTKPLRVCESYYLDTNGTKRPVNQISWEEWSRLSQVNQPGQINSIFVDKQRTYLGINTWMVPDTSEVQGTLHLVIQGQVTNAVSLLDDVDFPAEWMMGLKWGLADEVCTGQPGSIVQRCQQRASMYREALEGWDREDTPVTFSPSPRSAYDGGSFR